MIVRRLSTVDNTRDYAPVSHSRQWSNYNVSYHFSCPTNRVISSGTGISSDYCVWVCWTVQLRVRVVEGRQLQGNNISPVCRVSIRRQVNQTDVCPSTNAPVWKKSFAFTLHVSLAEIVDDILMFEVCWWTFLIYAVVH